MLQFGEPKTGVSYRLRPAAFGVAVREGRIAVVHIRPEAGGDWIDLPGGAVEAGEGELQALVREFGEEAGLAVTPGLEIVRIGQYFEKTDGEPVNNQAGVYEIAGFTEASHLKIEADHELIWIAPYEAIEHLRHDGHAWAVAAWLRRQ
jgi:8-oxo-dGTP diphosphatase